MTAIETLYGRMVAPLDRAAPALIPSLARLVFAGTLLVYYWTAGLTKLGDGPLFGLFSPGFGAYGQILPRAFEAAGYDIGQLGALAHLTVIGGTLAEFILPLLIVIGLGTRIAALGMIVVVAVQSWVDIMGHGLGAEDIGGWFDAGAGSLIADQRAFWVFLLAVLVLRGAGPLSVDAALTRYRRASFTAAPQPR